VGLGMEVVRGRGRQKLALLLVTAMAAVFLPSDPEPAEASNRCPSGVVALTFDDGPHATYTRPVLDHLAARSAVATFFPIGSQIAARPALVRRMTADGHRVANHTYHHERLTSLSDAAIRSTADRTTAAVRNAGATPLKLVRPPYGATDRRVRSALSAGGYGHVRWTVDPQDWRSISASTIQSRVLANLHPNAVILLHDGSSNSAQTVVALPSIIDGIRNRGYCLGLLDDDGRVAAPPTAGVGNDFSGDGTADLIAREHATGYLWLYPGNGRSGFLPRTQIGRGWHAMDAIVGANDFNGDGKADLITREHATGYLWLYPGNGRSGFLPRTQIGRGWHAMDVLL
jgi:peptidoglycan-N-acetylglucosamine deacetylase